MLDDPGGYQLNGTSSDCLAELWRMKKQPEQYGIHGKSGSCELGIVKHVTLFNGCGDLQLNEKIREINSLDLY